MKLPNKKYNVIVVDPPWSIGSFKHTGRVKHHIKPMSDNYSTMTFDEIKSINIKDISSENCFIFLWTTHTFLPKAFDLLEYWGFKYHLCLTWDKGRGLTHFGFHRKTEFVLFGYNGKLIIDCNGKAIDTIFYEYNRGHSIKPDIFYNEILRKFSGSKIDIFARKQRYGFDSLGDEVEMNQDQIDFMHEYDYNNCQCDECKNLEENRNEENEIKRIS